MKARWHQLAICATIRTLQLAVGVCFILPAVAYAQVSTVIARRPLSEPVAARDLPRGTVLTEADIQRTGDVGHDHAPDHARDVEHDTAMVAAGWITRRQFRAGEPLRPPGVSRPDLVTSGDPVAVIYANDGVLIKLTGTAIGNGAEGDVLYVRLQNRKRLRAVVTGPLTVKVVS